MNKSEQMVTERLLSHLEPRTASDIDLYRLCECLGVDIMSQPIRSTLAGTEGNPVIVLDSRLEECEQRVDLAHELCHYIAHAGHQLFLEGSLVEMQEEQAENMTTYLLCPTSLVQASLEERTFRDDEEAATFLAYEFNVPLPFARKRLRVFRQQYKAMNSPKLGRDYDRVWEHPFSGRRLYFKNGDLQFAR